MATLRLLLGLLLGALLIGGTAVAQPMSGTYTIGDQVGDDYASFTDAVIALTANGVDGPVTFNVEPLTYSESVTIGSITGASETNTITFRDAGTLDTPPQIWANATPAVNLNGADYVTFDGIDITLTVNGKVVQILGDADYNTIKNCTLTGASQTVLTNWGVDILAGGNDYNVIENVTVNRSVYLPVRLYGTGPTRDQGNEIRNCTFIGGRYGLYVQYQNGSVVHDCDIQPGYDGATVEVAGIYAYTQAADQLWTAYGNKIHNIRGSRANNGINANPGTGGLFKAYNNFVYDFQVNVTGTTYHSYALRVASGTAEFYFNSVYIGDVVTAATVSGFYGAGTAAVLENNIFQIAEPTATSYAINRNAGTLTSDYNCVYGSGTGYNMGRDGSTNYATLALWQAGTPYDDHSVEGNPGFMGPTDLHIDTLYTLVESAGTPIAGITDDIDGDLRGAAFPDIGADEYGESRPGEVDSLTVYPDADAGDAILRWAPSAEANSYKVYRGPEYGFVVDGTTYIGQTASTTYADVGVLATTGEKYYVVIASTDIIARGR